ncbi:hypothetical protein ACQEU5_09730 [Marinactinospora thermotolerans]|uniref:Uncharacterized protein n=1 Tax=Marinactinospora thermotolerans DSM 45154 TaxID=1122192 RepID=A0A1T4NAE3_9ACTN|nr:hypothetical protein [Marinactinospora thermotolerans]SJZ76065.1 hypothetical protein SAMN02745673_01351 [Marinactinospora thermotolerans DSM 45154]
MSHPRLNNPRAFRVKCAEAARVKRPPRHAFCAEKAIAALWAELSAIAARPMYRAGGSDLAVISVRRGVNVWCRNGKFIWSDLLGGTVTHPANDPAGAAALLRSTPPRRPNGHRGRALTAA